MKGNPDTFNKVIINVKKREKLISAKCNLKISFQPID